MSTTLGWTLAMICGIGQAQVDNQRWPMAMASSDAALKSSVSSKIRALLAPPVRPDLTNSGVLVDPLPYSAYTHHPIRRPNGQDTGISFVHLNSNSPYYPKADSSLDNPLMASLALHDKCLALINSGNPSTAEALEREQVLKAPDELNATVLLDLELQRGEYQEAFEVSAGFIQAGHASDRLLYRASLAAIGLGKIYVGQREFLIKGLVGAKPEPGNTEDYLPKGDSIDDLRFLTNLQLGLSLTGYPDTRQFAERYFEAAMRYSPRNPYVALELADDYSDDGQLSKALNLIDAALPITKPGDVQVVLKDMKRSFSFAYKKHGDGHGTMPLAPVTRPSNPRPW